MSLGALNYSVSLGRALGCPRFTASLIKRGLYFLTCLPLRAVVGIQRDGIHVSVTL